MINRRWLHLFVRALVSMHALLMVATVAWPGEAAAVGPKALVERVQAYWNARRDADLGAAYEFYSAQFKAAHPRTEFLRNYQRLIRIPPDEAQVVKVDLGADGKQAAVKVMLRLTREFSGTRLPIEAAAEEVWILEEGLWRKKDEPFVPNV